VMSMSKFCEEVRRGLNDVQQASGQLTQIIEQVQALAPHFEAVHEGMQAQSTGAEQISQALTHLSDAARQTVASLRESSQTIDQLSEVSIRLRSGISRFQLEAA
jgi:methyl-accepting chemotaxis protein WspA